ncbi:9872_t:CDS:2, partial [Paraglomus brasilianum]
SLQYRNGAEDFTYDKRKLWTCYLKIIVTLNKFEVIDSEVTSFPRAFLNRLLTTVKALTVYVTAITQPDAYVPTGCQPTSRVMIKKKSHEDKIEKESAKPNSTFDECTTAVNAVKSVQEDNESAHTDPLWWGVLDFREDNASPSPNLPRAKDFLSTDEVNRLMSMTRKKRRKISVNQQNLS